jgi:hypothetical protein
VKFQITQVSNVGTSNPIVARLGMGLDDIIKMAQIPAEKRTQILEYCVEIMHALVEAEKSAKPLLDEMRQIEQKMATEGIKLQPNAIETPGVMNLQNSRVFLKWAKQAL